MEPVKIFIAIPQTARRHKTANRASLEPAEIEQRNTKAIIRRKERGRIICPAVIEIADREKVPGFRTRKGWTADGTRTYGNEPAWRIGGRRQICRIRRAAARGKGNGGSSANVEKWFDPEGKFRRCHESHRVPEEV